MIMIAKNFITSNYPLLKMMNMYFFNNIFFKFILKDDLHEQEYVIQTGRLSFF